ncbi:hypothetical protein AAL_04934 [Moelleriella libera RCEF 2490]|uniref:Uncharacterized protein n=1 Tax=Moelleriella libera RCEF 2490 TaxID=1081109 RepID=A0A162IKL2_9HYPO|nr:hypothetical protein AAL_04934 [Moelleriella libera RCEF 2490]
MEPSTAPPRSSAPAAHAPAPSVGPAAAPSSTAADHLARFEFSDLGTKILMVEWHPGGSSSTTTTTATSTSSSLHRTSSTGTAAPAAAIGTNPINTPLETLSDPVCKPDGTSWEVSWPGKSTFLPATETDDEVAGTRRRVYFLLPPQASIPTEVTITPPGRPSIVVKPLPAIFPPGFHAEAGSRGVLHTLWAKKRLSKLAREVDAEMRANAESVGLEMALTEKQWIVDNFLMSPPAQPLPLSPLSPVPSRLGDKFKGLRLATSPGDLGTGSSANTFTGADVPSQTLSPQGTDIAVSSFSSIPYAPQEWGQAGPISLNAAMTQGPTPTSAVHREGEDDLFALPLSPRSIDTKRSPFSVRGLVVGQNLGSRMPLLAAF